MHIMLKLFISAFTPQSVIMIRSVFLLYVERLFVGFLQA